MLIPTTRYEDCAAALAFLKDALAAREIAVMRDGDGAIVHAELAIGEGVFMFGPAQAGSDFDAVMTSPAATDGRETTTVYAVLPDVDAAEASVRAAGGDVFLPLTDHGYGRMFSFRDPEGHVWSVGDYVPGAPAS